MPGEEWPRKGKHRDKITIKQQSQYNPATDAANLVFLNDALIRQKREDGGARSVVARNLQRRPILAQCPHPRARGSR
jgi:hypothetical protein